MLSQRILQLRLCFIISCLPKKALLLQKLGEPYPFKTKCIIHARLLSFSIHCSVPFEYGHASNQWLLFCPLPASLHKDVDVLPTALGKNWLPSCSAYNGFSF